MSHSIDMKYYVYEVYMNQLRVELNSNKVMSINKKTLLQSIPFIVNGSVQQKVFTKAGYSL